MKMSEYDRIRKACLKRAELWEDPDFPATQSSVFYHQTPPFQFNWKRPKELCTKPAFLQDATSKQFDIISGKMGDRWLVSCLSVLYLNKGLFYRVVPADQSFNGDQYAGVFRFRLWWCGEWTEVLVDDRLPTVHGRLAFLQSQHSDHFWPGLLEKAYAKLHGSYEALKYGSLLDGLADLTGGITESIPLNPSIEQNLGISYTSTYCAEILDKLLGMTSIVTCTIQTPNGQLSKNTVEKLPNGIQPGLNYRVCRIEMLEKLDREIITLVKISNPLASSSNTSSIPTTMASQYNGPWSPSSSLWQSDLISARDRERLLRHVTHTINNNNNNESVANCEFWMSLDDLVSTFTHLEIVHLDRDTSRDEPSLSERGTWQMRLFQGNWLRGVSAGGCRNNADTFHINPQLHLVLSDGGDGVGDDVGSEEIVVSLNQHSVMEPKVVGFTCYSLPKGSTDTTMNHAFFQRNKSLFNSQYTNSRQVSYRCRLEAGNYLLMPTVFEPGQESGFTLRVYSGGRRALKLRPLDTVPALLKSALVRAPPLLDGKSFSQYEAVFLQLADEHRTVNSFELQELLDACLPNDYIKSCASIDVCRQVVLAFDTVGNGRLKFSDFKDLMCSLKYWQTSFKSHTKEKTGILKAERLRDALETVGFQLSSDVLVILILRYMRKDGTLRFGDFVSAILHLTVSFNIFENKNLSKNGAIKLNLAEWLKQSLTC